MISQKIGRKEEIKFVHVEKVSKTLFSRKSRLKTYRVLNISFEFVGFHIIYFLSYRILLNENI